MNNTNSSNPKFAMAVDYLSNNDKPWCYISLEATDKTNACIEATLKAVNIKDVLCVYVLKRVNKTQYKSIKRIYPDTMTIIEMNETW